MTATTIPSHDLRSSFASALQRELSQSGDSLTAAAAMRAAAVAARESLMARWSRTQAQDRATTAGSARRIHYLSMEFLIGRSLGNALAALGLAPLVEEALAAHGIALADALEDERDAALGNGGLGRLAACFLDSFAELGLPSFGYGLRYRFGIAPLLRQHLRGQFAIDLLAAMQRLVVGFEREHAIAPREQRTSLSCALGGDW